MTSEQQMNAAVQITKAVADAIRELKEVPSGHLYAQLMGSMSLETYNMIIQTLRGAGLVSEQNHVLYWNQI